MIDVVCSKCNNWPCTCVAESKGTSAAPAPSDSERAFKEGHIRSALGCSWEFDHYDYEQVAKQLNLVLESWLREARNEAQGKAALMFEELISGGYLPHGIHVEWGIVFKKDDLISAIRALAASEPAVQVEGAGKEK